MPKPKLQSSYDSIGAAAAALGQSVAFLRRIKKLGAPGFRGSRVYPAEFAGWLKANADVLPLKNIEDKAGLEVRKLTAQCERLEHMLAVERGEYLPKNEVNNWIATMATNCRHILLQRLCRELPIKLEGMRVPEMTDLLEREIVGPIIQEMREISPTKRKAQGLPELVEEPKE